MNKNNEFTQLFQAILSIDNIEECKSFFEDICTVQELEKMAQRLEAAKLLLQGQTYEQVIEKTKTIEEGKKKKYWSVEKIELVA